MTTRLRETAPCARAMSTRNAGAAKLSVNAATPSRRKSRRETFIADSSWSSNELILARSRDEPRQARRLRVHLRLGSGPRSTCVQIRHHLVHFLRVERSGRQTLEHGVQDAIGLCSLARAQRPGEV